MDYQLLNELINNTESIDKKHYRLFSDSLPCPRSHSVGHYAMMTVVCLSFSVCLSVPDPKLRMEGRSKLKIGRKEACAPRPHLDVKRSKDQDHQAN